MAAPRTDWQAHDPGASSIILVGPVLQNMLDAKHLRAAELEGAPQIAIDGGIRHATNPVLWAGDGDSGAQPKNIPAFVKTNQDETDLRFCLHGIHNWRWRALHLFGFLGGRRDHELANFGEVHAHMKARRNFERAVFYGADNAPAVYVFAEGEHALEVTGRFSVLALEPLEISISGDCAYAAENLALEPLSGRGVSNTGTGLVRFRAGAPFMALVAGP